MATQNNTQSHLMDQFNQFHSTLSNLKQMAKTGTWVYSTETNKESTSNGTKEAPVTSNLIFQKFISLFEAQEIAASKVGGDFGATLYREALFIMCALADEVFLTLDWVGQKAWSRFLLETRFFESNAGGDLFFEKLETLLQDRDPVYSEIGSLFLITLTLGFRGKFHGINDHGIIGDYKKQLYSFVFSEKPDLTSDAKPLFPDAYNHTLEKESKAIIPGLKKWYGLVAGLLVVFLGVSHLIWINMTSDLVDVTRQILGQG